MSQAQVMDLNGVFRALFEASPDAMILSRPDGQGCLANSAAQDLLGYSQDEFAGLMRADLFDEHDGNALTLASHHEPGDALRLEIHHRRKDGSVFMGEARSSVFYDRTGNIWSTMVIRDLTERERVQNELREIGDTYTTVVDSLFEGVIMQDASGHIYACNESALRILGLTLNQVMGLEGLDPNWRTIRPDGSVFPGAQHPAMLALGSGRPVRNVDMGVFKPDCSITWISMNSNPLFRDGQPHPYAVVTSFADITQRTEMEQELERQALTDSLTGAGNRRAFMARAEHDFAVSRRLGVPFSLLVIDLDHFKRINDTYGHAVGDEVLKAVSACLQSVIRTSDYVGRLGGEEFGILLPGTPVSGAAIFARRMRQAVEMYSNTREDNTVIKVTISVGQVTMIDDDDEFATMLRRADMALYVAKESGRNRVVAA